MTESDLDGPEAADAESVAVSAEAAARYSGMWQKPGDETECVGLGVTKGGVGGPRSPTSSWVLSHMKGNQFATL